MTPTFEDYFSLIGSLAISVFCGLPLLVFAAITFFAGRKHAQNESLINSAASSRISTLKPGNRLVRLEGVIKEVPNKLDGPADSPLAFIRLKVEEYDSDEGGLKGAGDKMRSVPFRLEDETGGIWVDPQGLDKHSLGAGHQLGDQAAAEAAAILAGLNPVVLRGDTISTLWELRGGQRVTVIGTVLQREGTLVIAKEKKQILIISTLLAGDVQVQMQQQVKRAWIMTSVLGGLGLMGICCGLGFLVFNLTRFTGS